MNVTKALVLLSFVAGLAACSSTPIKETPPAPAPVATAKPMPPSPPPPPPPPESTVTTVNLPAYLDPNNPLSTQRSIFFDFDDYSVKSDYVPIVERHGKFLAGNSGVAIKVEGNTDERGGSEYNLALGQKRAEAVVKSLKVYGAKDTQMEAVSFGKERPKAEGHDESAWSQNRRVDLTYPRS